MLGQDIPQVAAAGATADFRLLLAHRPAASYAAAKAGFDLQLSGHTHGGQFFPFNLIVRMTHRYHRGLARVGRMWLYVCAGAGYWGPPHRFWAPSEIAVLRLVRAEPRQFTMYNDPEPHLYGRGAEEDPATGA